MDNGGMIVMEVLLAETMGNSKIVLVIVVAAKTLRIYTTVNVVLTLIVPQVIIVQLVVTV